MSNFSNYIDLTADSDDEARIRGYNGPRAHIRPIPNPYRTKSNPLQYRDSLHYSAPGLSAGQSSGHLFQRQQPFFHHHAGTEKRQTLATVPRHFTLDPSHMIGNQDARRTSFVAPKHRATTVVPPKPHTKLCFNCAEVNVTCDGEQPCSACVEPGLVCYYPGEKPSTHGLAKSSVGRAKATQKRSSITNTPNHQVSRSASLSSTSRPTSTLPAHVTQQSDLLPNRLLSANGSWVAPGAFIARTEEDEVFLDSDGSDDDDVPLAIVEVEDVKRLLRKHEARMRDHRAYLLQPLLSQSRLDASKAPGPDRPERPRNPFAGIVAKAKPQCATSPAKFSTIQLHVKSNKLGSAKKWVQISASLKVVKSDPTILPKYKSIGRLGTSLLAPNIRTLKYWPYFPDEENLDPSEAKKNEELEERYQHDDNHLLAQRKCSELVDMWQPWVKDFVSKLRIEFSDILYWFLHTKDNTTCEMCERDVIVEAFSEVLRLLVKPTERSLTLARLSTIALKDVAKVSMWHFVLGAPSVKDLLKQIEPPKKSVPTLCSVCFLHNCLSHGAYQEPEESGGAVIMGGNIEINDEESTHNIHLSAAVPNKTRDENHQCGLYCVAAEARVKDVLGRRKDGSCGGIHNHTVHVPRLSLKNDCNCSENCYWPVEKRSKFGTVSQTKDYRVNLPDKSKILFRQLLRIYSDNQRAPCMLAGDVDGLECIDAFYFMLAEIQRVSHYRQAVITAAQGTRKISKLAAGFDTTLSADLDERPPFVPCSHTGPCLNNPDCTCARDKVHCEWFCGCDKTCERRFSGCKCAGVAKSCFNDKSCECWKHNRECDPWLCGTCGVVEVLDPQNKYNDHIRGGRCKNNRIQLELPARTIKAPSEVQGWGLYAGADLDEQAFIGEYKGETVGNQESDRRGAVYANIGQEYLFVMNRDQQIDGSNFGNKTRFINNSQRDDYINVYAKKLLCNGVQRVMLYAKKPIRAGEELLYNYNYPVSVTKKFWERGEGPMSASGAVVAKPSITWTQPRVNGRFARVASKQDGEQSPAARNASHADDNAEDEDDPTARREAKRKRTSEGFPVPTVTSATAVVAKHAGSQDPAGPSLFADDVNDSDFELIEASESESVDEAEVDSDPAGATTSGRRRRVVHPSDRRRGGLAQAKAWETRRKRTTKGK